MEIRLSYSIYGKKVGCNLSYYFHLKCYSINKSREKNKGRRFPPPFYFCYGEKGTNTAQKAEMAPDPIEIQTGRHEPEEKPTKPRHFRKRAQEEIGKNYPSIVRRLAEEATQGSVLHTKLLFDLGGVKEEVREPAKENDRGDRPA